MKRLLLVLTLFLFSVAHAAPEKKQNQKSDPVKEINAKYAKRFPDISKIKTKPWCKSGEWTKKIPTELKLLKASMEETPRPLLIKTLWTEAKATAPRPFVVAIAHFLAYSESNKKLKGYYQAFSIEATGGKETDEAMKEWPKISSLKSNPAPLENLCRLYENSGGKDFN